MKRRNEMEDKTKMSLDGRTRADFDFEGTRVESPPTLFEGKQREEGKPFVGWLAIMEGNQRGEAFHLYEGILACPAGNKYDCVLPLK